MRLANTRLDTDSRGLALDTLAVRGADRLEAVRAASEAISDSTQMRRPMYTPLMSDPALAEQEGQQKAIS